MKSVEGFLENNLFGTLSIVQRSGCISEFLSSTISPFKFYPFILPIEAVRNKRICFQRLLKVSF